MPAGKWRIEVYMMSACEWGVLCKTRSDNPHLLDGDATYATREEAEAVAKRFLERTQMDISVVNLIDPDGKRIPLVSP